MRLSANYYFLAKSTILMAVANVAFFGLVAWLVWAESTDIPLWGPKSLVVYVLVMSIFSGFVLCFLATKTTHVALRKKRIQPLHWHFKSQTMIDQLPSQSLLRSLVVSLMGGFLGFLVLFLFHLLNRQHLPAQEFFVFNLIYAAHLAAGGAGISVYRAMGDYSNRKDRYNIG